VEGPLRRVGGLVEEHGRCHAVDPEHPLAAGEVAVGQQVEAALLRLEDVGVDVAHGPGVAAVGVVVEAHAPVLVDARAQHLHHLGRGGPEIDVEHLVGVDPEHLGELRHP
jgi:hypothetical protein